jgi:glycosyltransferase involved in cell wall biosynthesis
MKKATWLIIEPTFFGHHYTYLENILEQAFINNINVIIATQNDKDGNLITENILNKFEEPPAILCFGKMPKLNNNNIFNLFGYQIKVRSYFKSIYKKAKKNYKIDHVFIPYIDDFTFSLSLLGSPFGNTTFSGIVMRLEFHLDINLDSFLNIVILKFKKFLFLNLVKKNSLKNVFIIDPKLKEYFDVFHKNISYKVRYFADPVNDLTLIPKNKSFDLLKIPFDNLVILIFGFLDSRKGVDILIDWAILNSKISPITILLIGTQSPEIKNFIKCCDLNPRLQLIVKDEFVSESSESLYFSAADIVWVAYPNFQLMSSVLVKAAQAETNILYYEKGLISYFANKYGNTLQDNTFFMKKGFILNNGLKIKSFASPKNRFISDHSWKNAGYIFFNS